MSATNTALAQAADDLSFALETRTACAPIKELVAPHGIDGAYTVQEILTKKALTAGRALVGRKIGLTAKAVQQQLGVDQPDYGMLFADMEFGDGEPISLSKFIAPRVEAEIAFVIERDLDDPGLSLGKLVQAVAFALPAIEIVDSRVADWKISIFDTIADNASSGAYVLGGAPVKIDQIDLRLCGMVLESGGDQLSSGCGAACLGNPLNAALWLARKMIAVGRPLKAGDVVLSGALGPMVSVTDALAFQARINGLGSVTARFEN